MRLLQAILGRARGQAGGFDAPIAPDAPFFAVGDVHGRDDLLGPLLARLGTGDPVVLVGDYVDRGEQSAAVLRRLAEWSAGGSERICLTGNHEEMLLGFLDNPSANGARWLRNGGLQTMASFGIGGVRENMEADALARARDRLRRAMGGDLERWLRGLPLHWQSGNVAVVHAGADPATPIERQPASVLTWGHPDFARRMRADGVWVVHGHTITAEPKAHRGRICVDTGAYATGRLTAVHVLPGEARFLQA